MTCTACNHPALSLPAHQPPIAPGLFQRLQALWHPFQRELAQHRMSQSLGDLNDRALCDINAPEWLRRDLLHRAEMEHYERMRTLSQFRGIL